MVSAPAVRRALSVCLATVMAFTALWFGSIALHAAGQARARPLLDTHVDLGALATPPTTADCLRLFHRACYQPAQFQQAYNLKPLYQMGYDGRGRTIVIVDAFGSPTIREDLATFDKTFGLPDPPKLDVISPAGAIPTFDPNNGDMVGWAGETTLDVEYAHAIAPGASILLVETPVSETEGVQGFPEIVKAENYVIDHGLGDVISQSFGATEETFPSRQSLLDLRGAFKNAYARHVTVLASSGDSGSTNAFLDGSCCYERPVNSWPSSDPLVTSIGGTQLHLDQAGNRTAPDNVWDDPTAVIRQTPGDPTTYAATGGGPSHVFSRPAFQAGVGSVVGGARGTPDVSMSGACDGAAVFYYTYVNPGYHLVCGTSESSPLFSGIVAIADQIAGKRLGWLDGRLYLLGAFGGREGAAGLVDVTKGDNHYSFFNASNQLVDVPGFPAGPGYDMSSGWGTVDAARFTFALAALGSRSEGGPEGG
jgi:subtilase family serine protease